VLIRGEFDVLGFVLGFAVAESEAAVLGAEGVE
jgi:hypothetical protein